MEKFKRNKLIVFLGLVILMAVSFFFFDHKLPVALEHGTDFPYLEMEICVDSEAGKIFRNNKKQPADLNGWIHTVLDQAVSECELVINQVIDLVVIEYKKQPLSNDVNKENLLFLKKKIQTDLIEKYFLVYTDSYHTIIDNKEPDLKYNEQTKAALKNRLEEGQNNFRQLVDILESEVKFEN